MKKIELKQYYSAGGKSGREVMIAEVTKTAKDNVWFGHAILPTASEEQKVVIYQLELENGDFDYRTIPARCPHQGADITDDELKADGNVYCAWHRRPICVYSEYNQAFPVEKRAEQFIIIC